MGKINFIGIFAMMVLLASCNQSGKQTGNEGTEFQTQAEINEASYNDCVAVTMGTGHCHLSLALPNSLCATVMFKK